MARSTVFIEQQKKGDDKLTFNLNADFEWAPSDVGIILERPFRVTLREERGDRVRINPALGDKESPCYKLVEALKKIEGIAHVEMRGYWMRVKIGRAFQPLVNNIMLQVIEAIDAAWDEDLSFKGFSPYVTKHWQEFRFETKDRTFLPRLITTMFGESAGMVIPGSWDGFIDGLAETTAFASGFKIDSITLERDVMDSWSLEMMKSLGADGAELITATCTTPWRVNRSGKYEDVGCELYGGKLHFNIKSGMGIIYDPEHK